MKLEKIQDKVFRILQYVEAHDGSYAGWVAYDALCELCGETTKPEAFEATMTQVYNRNSGYRYEAFLQFTVAGQEQVISLGRKPTLGEAMALVEALTVDDMPEGSLAYVKDHKTGLEY
jgi:hypothetical protein